MKTNMDIEHEKNSNEDKHRHSSSKTILILLENRWMNQWPSTV